MCDRKNTVSLESALRALGVDLATEMEISVSYIPTIVDVYAVVACMRALAVADLPVPAHVDGDQLMIQLYHTPKHLKGVSVQLRLWFNNDDCLARTDVIVNGCGHTLDKYDHLYSEECGGILFSDVDITMLLTLPTLMAPFTSNLFQFIFNSDYDEDFVKMMLLDGEHVKGNHRVLVNGKEHAVLVDQQSWCLSDSEIPDLLVLAAILFHRHTPEQADINFVFEPGEKGGHPILAIEDAG